MNKYQKRGGNETHDVEKWDIKYIVKRFSNLYSRNPLLTSDDDKNSYEKSVSSNYGNSNFEVVDYREIQRLRYEIQNIVSKYDSFSEELFSLSIEMLNYLFPSSFCEKMDVNKWAFFLLDWLDHQITVIGRPLEDVVMDFVKTINLNNLDSAFLQENIFKNKYVNQSESGIIKLFFKLEGKIKTLYGGDKLHLSTGDDLDSYSSEDTSSDSDLESLDDNSSEF